jgi:predicted outer membrane repeat protein
LQIDAGNAGNVDATLDFVDVEVTSTQAKFTRWYGTSGNNFTSAATINVDIPSADTTAPTILSVTVNSSTEIEVALSETVHPDYAEDTSNYSLNNSATISDAEISFDYRSVTLTTSTLTTGSTCYTLTVDGVEDLSGNAANDTELFGDCGAIYVDDTATGSNDGSSWADAYNYLQDALGDAEVGNEIWVAAGTYYPDDGTGHTNNNRSESFELVEDVPVYGGFPNGGGTWAQRDPGTNVTTLSGDIGTIDTYTDNTYNIVKGDGDEDTILDGFTITKAYGPSRDGAGMKNVECSPTVSNCIFIDNQNPGNDGDGAGMHNYKSSPTVTDCVFEDNSAGEDGGGVCNKFNSNGVFTRCVFIDNTSTEHGGGIFNTPSEDYGKIGSCPTFVNCAIYGNTSGKDGGGAQNKGDGTDPTYLNCTFAMNHAIDDGGGMNSKGSGCEPIVKNCIFWDNLANDKVNEIRDTQGASTTVTYSDVEGGYDGAGNVNINPWFITNDYHLQQPGAPGVVDGGTVASYGAYDIDLEDRVQREKVDMGCDEISWPCTGLQQLGDADGDGYVEFDTSGAYADDYIKWWASYETAIYNACADFNRDGDVDLDDRTIGFNHNRELGSPCPNCQ